MRYVIARQSYICVYCKDTILEGVVCIQSQSRLHNNFYHEECHKERFEDSPFNRPNNQRPEE